MKKILFIAMLFSIAFVGCKKDYLTPENETPSSMNDLKVSDNFNWKTTTDVIIEFSTSVNGIVKVESVGGVVYQQAFLTPSQPYSMKLVVPSYEKNIQVIFAGKVLSLELNKTKFSIQL